MYSIDTNKKKEYYLYSINAISHFGDFLQMTENPKAPRSESNSLIFNNFTMLVH